MKKITLFLLSVSLLFLATGFTGCEDMQSNKLKIAQNTAQEIMDAFTDRNEEALYLILSQEAKNYYQTREQIQEAFDFIGGEIISYELPTTTGGGGKSVEKGEIVAESMEPQINNIKNDSGKIYRITFAYCLITEYNHDMEGLNQIIVSLMDENYQFVERISIGFELNHRFPQ